MVRRIEGGGVWNADEVGSGGVVGKEGVGKWLFLEGGMMTC